MSDAPEKPRWNAGGSRWWGLAWLASVPFFFFISRRRGDPLPVPIISCVLMAVLLAVLRRRNAASGDPVGMPPPAVSGWADEERVRKFGMSGMNLYVHLACNDALLGKVAKGEPLMCHPGPWKYQNERPVVHASKQLKPEELVGRYRDVTHCDECGLEFKTSDPGFIRHWVTTQAEIEIWERVQRDTKA